MSKGCIIYCIEAGQLEKNTLLSIASIKQFGGELNNYDIFCFQPRIQFPVSKKAKSALKAMGVIFIQKPLNQKHKYYALANKPIVCDYILKNYAYDQYIFLDSDTLILNEPTELMTTSGDISICAVTHKGVGMSGTRDANSEYWLKLLEHAHVNKDNLPFVETSVTREKIIAYWNTGVISFNAGSSICEEWNALVQHALKHKIFPDSGVFFVEQTCLSAVLMNKKYDVTQMSLFSNYPLTKKNVYQINSINLDEIAIMHHYNNLDLIKDHQIEIVGHDKAAWIQRQLNLLDFYPEKILRKISDDARQKQLRLKEKLYYFIYRLYPN